jgi:hypothetical protein
MRKVESFDHLKELSANMAGADKRGIREYHDELFSAKTRNEIG